MPSTIAVPFKVSRSVSICTDCDEASCSTSNELTAQCTDQCVVIACTDPDHGVSNCGGQGDDVHCDLVCDGTIDCTDCNGFDAFLQCCTDYHPYASEPHIRPNESFYGWDAAINELWCACNQSGQSQVSIPQENPPFIHAEIPAPPIQLFPEHCMWDNCKASFPTLSDLVGHVNLVHLRPSPDPQVNVTPYTETASSIPSSSVRLPCLWENCSISLSPERVAGSSTSSEWDNMLSILESHLIQDHLGLNPMAYHPISPSHSDPHLELGQLPNEPPSPFTTSARAVSPSLSKTTPSSSHRCQWLSCGESFPSCEDLTTHLSVTHVGSGKPRYECCWEGCNRSGTKGFTSKQKICRHLQSHTGHRPFLCQLCQQNFSEAATLQQHMRRHTQEKPYICDFPECRKSFAIMGALTIHKRTHNGYKPFRCTYCDRAFTESSNLSKHLRTHTGARPYLCVEDGCGKSFARPDQLTRHISTHKKRTTEYDGSGTMAVT